MREVIDSVVRLWRFAGFLRRCWGLGYTVGVYDNPEKSVVLVPIEETKFR